MGAYLLWKNLVVLLLVEVWRFILRNSNAVEPLDPARAAVAWKDNPDREPVDCTQRPPIHLED